MREIKNCPDTLVILGSGWNKALELTEVEERYSYKDIFGTAASVPGHTGELVVGRIGQKRVVFMSGRYHLFKRGYMLMPQVLTTKHRLISVCSHYWAQTVWG